MAREKTGVNWYTWGKDHTDMMKNCVYPCVWHGKGACPFRGVVAPDYLRWSDWVSCRTSSQMWGSWYFHRFLLRNASFKQMNIASLKVLVMPCASLSTMVNSPQKLDVLWSGIVFKWGMGLWDVPLAYPQMSFLIPLYILLHSLLESIQNGKLPHFLTHSILVFWGH